MDLGRLKKQLWVTAGIICLFLAILAYIIPLIPTPPFLAASLYCFAKGSRRFHDWLLYKTQFGRHLQQYREKRTLPKKFKVVTIIILVCGGIFSSVFILNTWWLRGILIFFITITIIFLLTIKDHK